MQKSHLMDNGNRCLSPATSEELSLRCFPFKKHSYKPEENKKKGNDKEIILGFRI